ncbi:MAG: MoxR family ATPase [Propionibacteriaceae bacterium]|jgi:MoxR-like ATPase|nr:MoxR family ATPase [Propionibacteriaceae bacterium]
MPITAEQALWFKQTFDQVASNVGIAIRGKDRVIRLALTCLLSEGHLLLEDNPGTGKTVLAKAIANTVQGTHSRIQFTPDLLPGDLTGVTVFDQRDQTFEFHKGPVFATIVLADEVNRASPKTQSALLEVMEEGTVTVDGVKHQVGQPFMVIATQNPIEQAGTYRLPEAQLDRFLMKVSVGYPDHEVAVELLNEAANRDRASSVSPIIAAQAVTQMAQFANEVYVDPAILSYVSQIATASRSHPHVKLGLSMRGGLAFIRAAKTWACTQGREYVTPDDIRDLAQPVMGHRLILSAEAQFSGASVEQVVISLLTDIAAPQLRAVQG